MALPRDTPTATRPTVTLERARGRYHYIDHPGDIYNDGFTETRWVADRNGPTILSRLVGRPGEQAPLFDVDYRVTVAHTSTGSVVHVRGMNRRDLRRLRRGLHRLVSAGHMPAAAVAGVRADIRTAMRDAGKVSVPLTVPVLVTGSRSAGHSHLWVETVMDFRTARRLALALGFVDRRYIRVCTESRVWQLNTPAA